MSSTSTGCASAQSDLFLKSDKSVEMGTYLSRQPVHHRTNPAKSIWYLYAAILEGAIAIIRAIWALIYGSVVLNASELMATAFSRGLK